MLATVKTIDGSNVRCLVRRNSQMEGLYVTKQNMAEISALKVGDKVEVKRQTNNPYLVFIRKA